VSNDGNDPKTIKSILFKISVSVILFFIREVIVVKVIKTKSTVIRNSDGNTREIGHDKK